LKKLNLKMVLTM